MENFQAFFLKEIKENTKNPDCKPLNRLSPRKSIQLHAFRQPVSDSTKKDSVPIGAESFGIPLGYFCDA